MKIRLNENYKSIGNEISECLEDIEFPNFSIITGTNGSGKTHLLEAIIYGKVKISYENRINDLRIYFNSFGFSLNEKYNLTNSFERLQTKHKYAEFIMRISTLDNSTYNYGVDNKKSITLSFSDIARAYCHTRELKLLDNDSLKEHWLNNPDDKDLLSITNKEWDSILFQMRNEGKLDIIERDKEGIASILSKVDSIEEFCLQKEYEDKYLGQSYFSSIKDYYSKKFAFMVDGLYSQKHLTGIELEQIFIEEDGESPIHFFNEVLE